MPFWSSSAPTFLDRESTIAAYRDLAARAARRDPRIRRVILFGSMATGRATPRSDADLLIVLSGHPARPIDRIPEYLALFGGGPTPVDVFPLTLGELERRTGEGDRFLARALSQGIGLLESPA